MYTTSFKAPRSEVKRKREEGRTGGIQVKRKR
jgi:hypothetical protein